MRRVGKKVARDIAELAAVRPVVEARSGNRCESLSYWPDSSRCINMAATMHHRLRRSQGGDNTVDNLMHVCDRCHDWIHANVESAFGLGYLLRPEPVLFDRVCRLKTKA